MRDLLIFALLSCTAAFPQEHPRGSFEFIHSIAGNKDDQVHSVAVGPDGSLFIAGATGSTDFETTPGSARRSTATHFNFQSEAFIRKLSSDGTRLLYSTYLGPNHFETHVSLGVDGAGNAYVAYLRAEGDGIPTRNLEPNANFTIVKLPPEGDRFLYRISLIPFGAATGFAVDQSGAAYAAAGLGPITIRKIDPGGTRIERFTSVECASGGRLHANALALGPSGSVYIAGRTMCPDYPATSNAYRPSTANPQNGEAFVMRFGPDLSAPTYSTLLGGESDDEAFSLAITSDGSATVVGRTGISDSLQPMPAALLRMAEPKRNSYAGFVATLRPDGGSLRGAALLPADSLTAAAYDFEGNLYLGGDSFYGALLARVSPDLDAVHYIVEPPAGNPHISSLALSGARLFAGGFTRGTGFPDNDPVGEGLFNGFAALLPEMASPAGLHLEVKASLPVPEVFGSYTSCRYEITNRGQNESASILLVAGIEGNALFGLWKSDTPVFNVPSFWTGSAHPTRAALQRLAPGESAAIEFLSNSYIFSGVRCTGSLFSAVADDDPTDNTGFDFKSLQTVRFTVNAPRGTLFRRDDWPTTSPVPWVLNITPNRQVRVHFPSPQTDFLRRTLTFDKWSDGSTENPRVFTVAESDLFASATFLTAPSGTPLGPVPEGDAPGNPPAARAGEMPLYIFPSELAAGAPEPVVVVNGDGFRNGWEVLWNGQPRATRFVNSYQLRVTLLPEDVASPSLGWFSVRDPESGATVRAPQAFWVHVPLANNDVLYDATRSRLWIAVPGAEGTNEHSITLLDPESGKVEQSLPIPAEPQKLALTSDSRFLYVATPGRIYRFDTESRAIDRDFPLPPTDFGSLPAEAYSMLTVPGRHDQLVVSLYAPFVSPAYRGTVLLEDGVLAARQLPPRNGPALLYGWLDERTMVGGDGASLYYARVEDGLRPLRTVEGVTRNAFCTLQSGLLHCSSGTVFNAATAAQVRQQPARGAVGLMPASDRSVFFGATLQVFPSGALFGPMVVVRSSTSEFLFAAGVPLTGSPGSLYGWGGDGLIYRPAQPSGFQRRATRLYLFKLP